MTAATMNQEVATLKRDLDIRLIPMLETALALNPFNGEQQLREAGDLPHYVRDYLRLDIINGQIAIQIVDKYTHNMAVRKIVSRVVRELGWC